jgi:predicted lipoprotein with Yx(FWY)xxD motif
LHGVLSFESLFKAFKGEKMKNLSFIGISLIALMLLVTACSPQATPALAPLPTVAVAAPTVAAPPPTAMPVDTLPATAAPAGATVMLGKNDTLGSFLVDDKNMTLYLFTKDTPNTSNCYDKCAKAWPPLLTTGAAVGKDGIDAAKLGTTKRTDGSTQVTYNGWPLYYFAKDTKPGDVTGEDVGQVWYVISAAGEQVMAAYGAPAAAAPAGTTVMLAKNDKLGSFLVDSKNMTLYLFTKDTPNTSNCYGNCAAAWPPLLTTGAAVAGAGIDAAKLGATKRTDGSMQVTYNSWPLYYFAKDTKPGDVTGEDVGNVWFLVSAAGDQIKAQ